MGALDDARIDELYALFARYYERADPARFRSDLASKQHVILLTEPGSGRVRGFSTQRVLEPDEIGRRCRLLYSGDTVVHRDYWGSKALHLGFVRLMLRLRMTSTLPLYWMLTTKGYKTYLLLANWFPEAWPRYDIEMSPSVRGLRDHIGRQTYGERYEPERGVIRLAGQRDRLRPGTADISASELQNPHIRFFAETNPGHVDGDELLCLARIRRREPFRILGRIAWKLVRP